MKDFREELPEEGTRIEIQSAPEQGEQKRVEVYSKNTVWIDGCKWRVVMNETSKAVKKYVDGGLPEIIKQLEMDEYESTGGFLRNNVAFEALKEMAKPKRKPDTNGVLPLTDEELKEFSEVVGNQGVYKVCVGENGVAYYMYQIGCTKFNGNAVTIRAILWLAERFNLTGGE